MRDDPTAAVGVVGFGRCGSTMLMHMLRAGGLHPAGDVSPGSLELAGGAAAAGGLDLRGRSVKLLDSVKYLGLPAGDPPVVTWRFVWLDREPVEQARSHIKLVQAVAPEVPLPLNPIDTFVESYRVDRPDLLARYRAAGYVLVMQYERVLLHPGSAARTLARHIWPTLDVDAAAAVVHDRDGRCRPDLAVEVAADIG